MIGLLSLIGAFVSMILCLPKKTLIERIYYFIWFLIFSILILAYYSNFKFLTLMVGLCVINFVLSLLELKLLDRKNRIQLLLAVLLNIVFIAKMIFVYFNWPYSNELNYLMIVAFLTTLFFLKPTEFYRKGWYYLMSIIYIITIW